MSSKSTRQPRLRGAILASLALAAAAAGTAHATSITGFIAFAAPSGLASGNGWDPSLGLALPGYGNTAGTTVPVGPGGEFGLGESGAARDGVEGFTFDGASDWFGVDAVDFSDRSIAVTTILSGGVEAAYGWHETFTADTPGYFAGLQLESSTFAGLTYGVSGDTLTLDWTGFSDPIASTADFSATFAIAPAAGGVPEPAAWSLMILGFGLTGSLLRRTRRHDATGRALSGFRSDGIRSPL